ncbi:TraR/DksA family transcriptional regulator [Raoultella ornithinolytica]|uniref:TraR/DksA family transcriptional regulator n=1 Tax=Raoultella ornithinolytica TaxID=54291 RepID=UPI003F690955
MDEIDRDQEFNELQLENMIAHSRLRIATSGSPSLYFCRKCGEAIQEKRRLLLPGVSLCIECQTELERKNCV